MTYKTAGDLAQAYEKRLIETHTKPLLELIADLVAHCDYCGWGDAWERDGVHDANGIATRAYAVLKANGIETGK